MEVATDPDPQWPAGCPQTCTALAHPSFSCPVLGDSSSPVRDSTAGVPVRLQLDPAGHGHSSLGQPKSPNLSLLAEVMRGSSGTAWWAKDTDWLRGTLQEGGRGRPGQGGGAKGRVSPAQQPSMMTRRHHHGSSEWSRRVPSGSSSSSSSSSPLQFTIDMCDCWTVQQQGVCSSQATCWCMQLMVPWR
jgi:hypothetical protein